ncbi:unnamed protein product [Ambrosiozyma monospora]|uniref:Unnamed protein product n=1 Tax=Ambrosiozyma monospora TaxID=43982 RepID=A0A9W6YV24_AMBMO|nr:unnamed protein product [Ambrosiozyma monospora]
MASLGTSSEPPANWDNTVIHSSLCVNSTTLCTYDNTPFSTKLNSKVNYAELISKQLSTINSDQQSRRDEVTLSTNLIVPSTGEGNSSATDSEYVTLVLYYDKKLLDNNDLITVLVLCSDKLLKSFVYNLLEKIMDEYLLNYYQPMNPTHLDCELKNSMKAIITQLEGRLRNAYSRSYGAVDLDIEEVRGIMNDNIDRILTRGENLDVLINKTQTLNTTANSFRRRTVSIKRKFWWSNVKFFALVGGVVFLVIYLLVGLECGLPFYQRCTHPSKPTQPEPPKKGHKFSYVD